MAVEWPWLLSLLLPSLCTMVGVTSIFRRFSSSDPDGCHCCHHHSCCLPYWWLWLSLLVPPMCMFLPPFLSVVTVVVTHVVWCLPLYWCLQLCGAKPDSLCSCCVVMATVCVGNGCVYVMLLLCWHILGSYCSVCCVAFVLPDIACIVFAGLLVLFVVVVAVVMVLSSWVVLCSNFAQLHLLCCLGLQGCFQDCYVVHCCCIG